MMPDNQKHDDHHHHHHHPALKWSQTNAHVDIKVDIGATDQSDLQLDFADGETFQLQSPTYNLSLKLFDRFNTTSVVVSEKRPDGTLSIRLEKGVVGRWPRLPAASGRHHFITIDWTSWKDDDDDDDDDGDEADDDESNEEDDDGVPYHSGKRLDGDNDNNNDDDGSSSSRQETIMTSLSKDASCLVDGGGCRGRGGGQPAAVTGSTLIRTKTDQINNNNMTTTTTTSTSGAAALAEPINVTDDDKRSLDNDIIPPLLSIIIASSSSSPTTTTSSSSSAAADGDDDKPSKDQQQQAEAAAAAAVLYWQTTLTGVQRLYTLTCMWNESSIKDRPDILRSLIELMSAIDESVSMNIKGGEGALGDLMTTEYARHNVSYCKRWVDELKSLEGGGSRSSRGGGVRLAVLIRLFELMSDQEKKEVALPFL